VAAIAREQLEAGHAVLVLVHEVAQGRAIASLIEGAVLLHSNSRKADTGGRSREGTLEAMRNGEVRCLIATSLADQGLDVPAVSCVVMAGGGKGGAEGYLIQQRVARAQRIAAGKDGALIVDVFHAGDSMTVAQSWARWRSYKSLGYAMATLPEGMVRKEGRTMDMFKRRAA
jgi:superfamily II DNA or RNA helicase